MHHRLKLVSGDMIERYKGDSKAILVQQNNCTSLKLRPDSLAEQIARVFYHGDDPYTRRKYGIYENLAIPERRQKMGQVMIYRRYNPPMAGVACLFAQYKMGRPDAKYYLNGRRTDPEYVENATKLDSGRHRLAAFRKCLSKLGGYLSEGEGINVDKVIFPYRIGCGAGGGSWPLYRRAISDFSETVDVDVIICKK